MLTAVSRTRSTSTACACGVAVMVAARMTLRYAPTPALTSGAARSIRAAVSSHTRLSYQLLHIGANIMQAVAWWRKAAEQGYHPACVDLAYAYRTGRGVAKDLGEALKWYKKAADAGSVHGMYAASHLPPCPHALFTMHQIQLRRDAVARGGRRARRTRGGKVVAQGRHDGLPAGASRSRLRVRPSFPPLSLPL